MDTLIELLPFVCLIAVGIMYGSLKKLMRYMIARQNEADNRIYRLEREMDERKR